VLHNRQFLLHWWHMLFNKCAYDNKHVSITDLLKVLSLFHQQALNRIGGVMVNVFVSWSHHLTKNGGLGPVTFHWGAYNKQVSGHVYVYLSVNFAFLRFFDLIFSLIRLVVFFYQFHQLFPCLLLDRRGRDRIVVGFTTTRPISA
jgi:hypothetical protein